MFWNEPGLDRLFVTHIQGPLPTHRDALKLIMHWMHNDDWNVHQEEFGGLVVPLVVHDNFVLVPETAAIEEKKGPILTIEPPCILWLEQNQKDGAVIVAVVIIR